MSLHDFVKILRQRWLVIVLTTLIAAVAMFVATPARGDTTPKIGSYTATATLLVGTDPTGEGEVQPRASLGRIELYVTTGDVPKAAAKVLKYKENPALLAAGLTVESDAAADALTITTTAADGERAALVANTFAEELVTFFDKGAPGAESTRLTILQEATPIPNRSSAGFVIPPDRNIRTALAAAIGLLLGLALALLLDRLDSRLRTRAEVAEALRVPVISEVPRLKRSDRTDGTILTRSKPLSIYADGYRAARTAIMHLPTQQVPGDWSPRRASGEVEPAPVTHVILVTSSHASEGKTTSVANLAASFAEAGKQVLVLDADLRSPDAHNKFDVPQAAGISDYVSDPARQPLDAMMRPTNIEGVRIVTAGLRLDYPASLTSRLAPLLDEARRQADIVLVDTAPLLAASDVFDILPLVDGIVLVVRSGRLTETAATRVAELLGRFRVPVVGAILIGGHIRKADYGSGYGYGEGKGGKKRSKRPDATDDSIPVVHRTEPVAERPGATDSLPSDYRAEPVAELPRADADTSVADEVPARRSKP